MPGRTRRYRTPAHVAGTIAAMTLLMLREQGHRRSMDNF